MFLFILWILISIWISYTDVFFRIISNIQILFIIALSTVSSFQLHLEINLLMAALILFIGIIIWRFGFLGAGDIKLICALSLIIPYDLIGLFLFLTSIVGAIIGIFIYICANFIKIEKSVPYGVAIMGSFLILFLPHLY
ncbi:hypothetical protein BKH42_05125 [Helicobacter sp. 13S00482-2]|uniref:prepilin peptidase n=1 Tax=Helicobacter sp. 13S00482-2 TaxID=1476200 RepID=UPI000BD9DD01|nr:prepilin peptidase [Helicobacter sp. 13S00482-2]PAF53566.1 hypothetical protein BKH42_05125 [Helicobacter sp. 13S00482-2]